MRPVRQPAVERFGWYVDRTAFGSDLYTGGRSARLRHCTGQDLLAWSWERVRSHAEQLGTADEVAIVDAMVEGRLALPCEVPDVAACEDSFEWDDGEWDDWGPDLTVVRRRGNLVLSTTVATWEHVVFEVADDIYHQSRYIAIPAHAAIDVIDAFESGELDAWARGLFAEPMSRVLSSVDQIGEGAVFGSVDPTSTLTLDERNPGTGRLGGIASPPGGRHQKAHESGAQGARPKLPKRSPVMMGLAASAAVVVLGGGGLVIATRGSSNGDAAPAAVTTTAVAPTDPPTTVATTVAPTTIATTVPATTEAPTTTTPPPTTVPVLAALNAVTSSILPTGQADTNPINGQSGAPTDEHRLTFEVDCAPDGCTFLLPRQGMTSVPFAVVDDRVDTVFTDEPPIPECPTWQITYTIAVEISEYVEGANGRAPTHLQGTVHASAPEVRLSDVVCHGAELTWTIDDDLSPA